MDISKGQRSPISQLVNGDVFQVAVKSVGAVIVDFSCFGIDATGKLSDERYMTFFNQPKTPCSGVEIVQSSGNDATTFQLKLAGLPATIDRLVITAAIDGTGTMSQLRDGCYLRFLANGQESSRFSFSGKDFADEKALMLGEIYRKNGEWRFCAVAQGFNGGLEALVKHFGGDVAPPPSAVPPVKEAPKVEPPAPEKKLSLTKVTLQKSGDKVSLEKRDAQGFGKVRVNLNWNRQPQKSGFLSFGNKKVDLDIGCMFEMTNGAKGVVQALGNTFGNYHQPPFISLEADDRTGASTQGENLLINGDHFDIVKRILVFAFIYEGVPNWAATDGVVTIHAPNQPPVEVRLDRTDSKGMCAVAMIENVRGQLSVTKLVEYFHGHSDMDKWFGFGFNWKAGSK
jgi:tellurite resistance protein TerA